MSAKQKKCRQYSIDYLKFGFVPSPTNQQLPMCLLCQHVFSNEAMKPSRLNEHFLKKHSDKNNKDILYFQELKKTFESRNTLSDVFKKKSSQNEKGLMVSYEVAQIIAKCGAPHIYGEKLILPAIRVFINNMIGQNQQEILSSIPLSNDTISRRIDEMASDIEMQVCYELQSNEFSLQLDESTLHDNESLLLAYARFVKNEKIIEEMLFAKLLTTNTTGASVFETLENFFVEKNIPFTNVIACATDGAPAMVGRYRGFVSRLKNVAPNVLTIHCIIHRHHLVAKHLSGRLHKSMSIVINVINKIKSHPLNDRLFRRLCIENDEEFIRLILHTEVRWLSKGNCLKRFYALFDTIVEFLDNENICNELKLLRNDVAYLSDIFEKINENLLKLQGDNISLIKAKGIVLSFIKKLKLYKNNLCRREYHHFPYLQQLKEDMLKDSDLETYCSHIDALIEEMTIRFKDLTEFVIPTWIINPFLSDVESVSQNLNEQFIELQNDLEAKIIFNQCDYDAFWVRFRHRYPLLWKEVKLPIMAFPSSYLVEKGFSAVMHILRKSRNRLQISQRGDLRLYLTKLEPNITKLVQSREAQGSH